MEQFVCLNRWKISAAGVWWLGSFAGAFHVFGFQELSREVPSEERWEGVELGDFFFRWRCFLYKWNGWLPLGIRATGNVLLRPEEYAIITTWRNSYLRRTHHISVAKIQRSNFFSFKVLLKSFEISNFCIFFFRLEKRSGCYLLVAFLFWQVRFRRLVGAERWRLECLYGWGTDGLLCLC